MDAKLHKTISELDEYIALCRKRLDGVLSGLNWTENVTLRDIGAGMLEREESEDEDDPPLPPSFGCENSVVIDVDQLKAIINDETASIAKKFSDIQINYTREQKREIYDYVIYNTKKLSEPEVKVTVSNNHQPTTNMTIAQIVAKAKANAKTQRRKYSTSKPTHIEEIREMLNLQMQALNQLYKAKPVQPHTNTSRQPHLDMLSPFIAPRRRSKRRDGGSPFRRPSLDMINTFGAPSCESSGERSQGDGPSESRQRISRENLARGSPRVDRISRSRSRARPISPSSSGMHRECGRRDLNECRRDLSNAGQDRRSLKQRGDGRHQSEENREKEKMLRSGRKKGQSRDKKSQRDKSRDRPRGDKRESRDKRYPSSGSSESRSTSSSRCKCRGKRSQVDIKRKNRSRSKSKETRQSHSGSEKTAKHSTRSRNRRRSRSLKKSSIRATVENAQQTPNNRKRSRSFRSPNKPPKRQASPKKSKSHSKSRNQDEKHQPSLSSSIEEMRKRSRWDSMSAGDTRPSSRASPETQKHSPTTSPTSKDIDQMLWRLQEISKKVAPKAVQVKAEPGRI